MSPEYAGGPRGAENTYGANAPDYHGVECFTSVPSAQALTLAQIARLYRDAMRDKSYQDLPMGGDVATYLRHKRKRLSIASQRSYESSLDKFARYFPDVQRLAEFEPPLGTERLEEYLDVHWGDAAPGTYNVNLAILADFFKWGRATGRIISDPVLAIDRVRNPRPPREIFSSDDRRRVIAAQDYLRDRIALRLLFDYGLRKAALQRIQFRHFDHERKRLMIHTKGDKRRDLPIPDPHLWMDLERHILDVSAQPDHYLMASSKWTPTAGRRYYPEKPMSDSAGMHRWWYRCLERAGLVDKDVTAGERMHKARHTAGQRMLDHTGNLVAVQKLLGHASIRTTADTYLDWDLEQLAKSLASLLDGEEAAS